MNWTAAFAGVTVIPAKARIQAIYMHSGEPEAHAVCAQHDRLE